MKRSTKKLDTASLPYSAVIFSPHPDDETLGCGGTVIKKRRAGADVRIVYMTDGRRSHVPLMSEDVLAELRFREAHEACKALGVDEDHIIFLGFHDARLSEALDLASRKVLDILSDTEPTEVFIPYHMESLGDHWATNKCVLAALKNHRSEVAIYEYPVWFWHHWPWISLPRYGLRNKLAALKEAAFSCFRLLRDFNHVVWIEDVLRHKHTALNRYKSQMSRLTHDSRWPILSDVSNGEWLKCFFQQNEVFYRYNLHDH
ncbi:MAG: PIG-L deacetylase family protein [Thermodesulfobacteriota bacterium]|nr:PIG-L deacetylase family protein [Thermodesulfobacteriota bacterium]